MNFSALTALKKRPYNLRFFTLWGWLVSVGVVIALWMRNHQPQYVSIAVFVLLGLAYGCVRLRFSRLTAKNYETLKQFANDNGWLPTYGEALKDAKPGDAYNLRRGLYRKVLFTMEGKRNAIPLTLMWHEFSINFGKREQIIQATSLIAHMPQEVPHLILGYRAHNALVVDATMAPGMTSSDNIIWPKGHKVSKFECYTEKVENRPLLEALVEQVVPELASADLPCTVELFERDICFIWRLEFKHQADFERAFALLDRLLPTIRQIVDHH